MLIKRIIGVLVLIFLGFLTFAALSAAGFIIGAIWLYFSWYHITLGTVFGLILVFIYYWDKI